MKEDDSFILSPQSEINVAEMERDELIESGLKDQTCSPINLISVVILIWKAIEEY